MDLPNNNYVGPTPPFCGRGSLANREALYGEIVEHSLNQSQALNREFAVNAILDAFHAPITSDRAECLHFDKARSRVVGEDNAQTELADKAHTSPLELADEKL